MRKKCALYTGKYGSQAMSPQIMHYNLDCRLGTSYQLIALFYIKHLSHGSSFANKMAISSGTTTLKKLKKRCKVLNSCKKLEVRKVTALRKSLHIFIVKMWQICLF